MITMTMVFVVWPLMAGRNGQMVPFFLHKAFPGPLGLGTMGPGRNPLTTPLSLAGEVVLIAYPGLFSYPDMASRGTRTSDPLPALADGRSPMRRRLLCAAFSWPSWV